MINFSELEPFEYYYISSNESYSIEYNKLIQNLPSKQKEVISLKILGNLTFNEIFIQTQTCYNKVK